MNKEYVTLKLDEELCNKMISYYLPFQEENNGEYVSFFAHINEDLTLTIYHSNKGIKALFGGNNALNEAKIWDENASINEAKPKIETKWKDFSSQIGSDEVGTGDFLGPVIVCASYIPITMIPYLQELGVDDSKKLTDKKILEIVPLIKDKIIHKIHICNPQKYNEMIDKGYTMNEIKAILHNDALIKVRKMIKNNNMICYVDQFASPSSYYSYLQKYNYQSLKTNIIFETKGESYYPSVAVSSMIARYTFLQYLNELSSSYQIEILKGASTKVDELALDLKNKYGIEELNKLVKKNFKNYQKLIEE